MTYEMAEKLYEMAEDMDFSDYEETKAETIKQLEKALYWLQAAAENPMNHDYFRTLFNCLEAITGEA